MLPALIVAVVLFAVSVAITFTVGAVLAGRIDRLEQRIEALQRPALTPLTRARVRGLALRSAVFAVRGRLGRAANTSLCATATGPGWLGRARCHDGRSMPLEILARTRA